MDTQLLATYRRGTWHHQHHAMQCNHPYILASYFFFTEVHAHSQTLSPNVLERWQLGQNHDLLLGSGAPRIVTRSPARTIWNKLKKKSDTERVAFLMSFSLSL
mmetsp:Transcript_15879/g.30133  ORF Transcript_15879/g.30133 Transcript_15879/m.30133 type:complete len:103 (+) Transcript_15879:221-529(+)